jgi:hypothetical protein
MTNPIPRPGLGAQREKMWAKVIAKCRKSPVSLLLSHIDQPENCQALVDGF